MKKIIRTLALILAHIGLALSILFLICLMIGQFVPGVAEFARLDFFVFGYFYLIIPLLGFISGILLQIATVRSKKKRAAKPAQTEKA